jgi:hypothetical protein
MSNCSTDRGEALHPQNRKDYSRSNKQASAQKQASSIFFISLVVKKVFLDVANGT